MPDPIVGQFWDLANQALTDPDSIRAGQMALRAIRIIKAANLRLVPKDAPTRPTKPPQPSGGSSGRARFRGTCVGCSKSYEPNEEIYWVKDRGIFHSACARAENLG